MHSVAVSVKDRDGNVPDVASTFGVMMNLDTGAAYDPVPGETLRVPPGRYSAAVSVATPRPDLEFSLTQLANPEFRVSGDMDLAFDARTGKPLDIRVDRPGVTGGEHVIEHRFGRPGSTDAEGGMVLVGDPRWVDHYAASTPGVSSKAYLFHNWLRGEEPAVALTATAPQRYDVAAAALNLDAPAVDATLGAVYGGAGTPEDLAKIDPKGKLVTLTMPDLGYEEVYARLTAVKAAGARAALVVPIGAWWIRGFVEILPTAVGGGVTSQRLLEASKKDGVTTRFVMRPSSRYAYHVANFAEGSIPAKADFLHRTRDLASFRTGYHVRDGVAANHYVRSELTRNGLKFGGWTQQVAPQNGGEQLEYFTPGTWRRENASMSGTFVWLHAPPLSLRAGQHRNFSWGKAVTGPNLNAGREAGKGAWVSRTGDKLAVAMPLYSDASGNGGMAYASGGSETSLYRDGALVGKADIADEAVFDVPPGEADFRLTTRYQNDVDWPLSTDVSAAWTFRSGHGAQVLPLLSIGFDPKVDFVNHAPGGKAFSFPATVARQAGSGTAAVRSLTVDVSYDEGVTWTPAKVTRHGTKWTVSVRHPKSGFVSLRAKAADAQGNRVEQTIVRAYGLK